MPTETTIYNVYRVVFEQKRGPDHEAIALVPAQNDDQGAGRFYHVIGDVGMGMDYDPRPAYRFTASKSYKGSTLQFQLPKVQLARFEELAAKHPPPHDPRVLLEANPNPPARNCSNWIDDVLAEARKLAWSWRSMVITSYNVYQLITRIGGSFAVSWSDIWPWSLIFPFSNVCIYHSVYISLCLCI